MLEYKLIVEYYLRGNNNTQIATLCRCSRTTMWAVLKGFSTLRIKYDEINRMSEPEFDSLLFSERVKTGQGYLIPDFKWEEIQIIKHRSSIRLCWRRYCKRAAKQGLKAYSWASFGLFYLQYKKPRIDEDDPHDAIRNKLKRYNLLFSYCHPGGTSCERIRQERTAAEIASS